VSSQVNSLKRRDANRDMTRCRIAPALIVPFQWINAEVGGKYIPTSNYPKILQSKFLARLACMISIVLGGLLEMVADKTILLLDKTIKHTKILCSGLPFHHRPMVT